MPRISVNKLGEYLVASAPRRKAIIKDQKFPAAKIIARYQCIADTVVAFFTGGGRNVDEVEKAIARLRADRSGTDWAIGNRSAGADLLVLLLKMRDDLFAPGVRYVSAPPNPAKLHFGGVDVSVRPDFILIDDRTSPPKAGAVKLHFIKDSEKALGDEGGAYVAVVLHQWMLKHYSGVTAAPGLSRSIDVFRRMVVKAPANQTRKLASINAACEEIAARWPLLKD